MINWPYTLPVLEKIVNRTQKTEKSLQTSFASCKVSLNVLLVRIIDGLLNICLTPL